MGVIPHLSSKFAKSVGAEEGPGAGPPLPLGVVRPQSAFAESLRLLRTSLMLSSPGAPPQVVVVTSGVPGDGKTMISLNLAAILGQKQKKVLLLDGDLRRSSLSGRLGLSEKFGLSSCLAGTSNPSDIVASIPGMPNVDFIAAGTRPPDPADLLDSDRMRALMATWRTQYEHIVIDTPPLLGLTDAALVSAMSDFVLLVVRASRTSRQTLVRARDALLRANCSKIGIVYNDLSSHSADHYAYYGYYGSEYRDYYGNKSREI